MHETLPLRWKHLYAQRYPRSAGNVRTVHLFFGKMPPFLAGTEIFSFIFADTKSRLTFMHETLPLCRYHFYAQKYPAL